MAADSVRTRMRSVSDRTLNARKISSGTSNRSAKNSSTRLMGQDHVLALASLTDGDRFKKNSNKA
jgi:hypothetical protein